MIRLLKNEFKLYYNKYIIISMMNIWGEKNHKKYVITYQSYLKMFLKPDGFLRNIIPQKYLNVSLNDGGQIKEGRTYIHPPLNMPNKQLRPLKH